MVYLVDMIHTSIPKYTYIFATDYYTNIQSRLNVRQISNMQDSCWTAELNATLTVVSSVSSFGSRFGFGHKISINCSQRCTVIIIKLRDNTFNLIIYRVKAETVWILHLNTKVPNVRLAVPKFSRISRRKCYRFD